MLPAIIQCYIIALMVCLLLGLVGVVGMLRGISDEAQVVWEIKKLEEDNQSSSSSSEVNRDGLYQRQFFRRKKHQ